ncbi:MAG: hypothetical protein ACK4UO_13060 [Pseudolabrys sp.]
MTLVSTSTRGGGYLSTGYHCFTVDEGRSDAEFICGTLTAAKTITGLQRGVDPNTGTTTNASLQFSHRVGANVKITDFPLIQRLRNLVNGTEPLPNPLLYQSHPCVADSASTTVCDKDYLEGYANNVIAGGSPTSTEALGGKVELATATEAAASYDGGAAKPTVLQSKNATSTPGLNAGNSVPVTIAGKLAQAFWDLTAAFTWTGTHIFSGLTSFTATSTMATTTHTGADFNANITNTFTAAEALTGLTTPQPVSWATSTAKVWVSDGDVASTTDFLGFALNSVPALGTAYVQTDGVVKGFSGLTTGARYYVSDTAGTISSTIGTLEIYVGFALSSTQLFIDKGPTSAMQLGSTTVLSVTSGTVNFIQDNRARFVILNYSVANNGATFPQSGTLTMTKKGLTSSLINSQSSVAGNQGCNYTLTWTGGNLAITESESTATCSLSGTIYWYR